MLPSTVSAERERLNPKRSRRRLAVYGVFAAGAVSIAAAGLALLVPVVLSQHERTASVSLPAPVASAGATIVATSVSRAAAPTLTGVVLAPPAHATLPQSGLGPERVKHRISSDLLAQLIGSCASEINPRTEAAIVAVESGGDAWAVRDDNDGSHYSPDSFDDAVAIEHVLRERDHRAYAAADRGIDVGLAQINTSNFAALRVDAAKMFDPCDNLHASAKIFAAAYSHERAALGGGPGADADQLALQRALQIYNSGKGSGDETYVRAILATLDTPFVRTIAPNLPNANGAETIAQQSSAPPFGPAPDGARAPAQAAPGPVAVKSGDNPDGLERSAVFVHVDPSAEPLSGRATPDKARE